MGFGPACEAQRGFWLPGVCDPARGGDRRRLFPWQRWCGGEQPSPCGVAPTRGRVAPCALPSEQAGNTASIGCKKRREEKPKDFKCEDVDVH